MPQLVIPDTVQVRLIWRRGGVDHAVNVIHFLNMAGTPVNAGMADGLAAVIRAAALTTIGGTTYAAWKTTAYTMDRLTVRNIDKPNEPEVPNVGAVLLTGTSVAQPLPPASSLVSTLRTSFAGKSFRGRIYDLGYGETANDNLGDPLPAAATRQTAFWNEVRNQANSLMGLQLAVASRKKSQSFAVTSIDTNTIWDTQRRRNRPGI